MAFLLALDLSASVLRLKPGATEAVTVTITNTSSVVQHYLVELRGLPGPDMATVPTEPVRLLPLESAAVKVTIALARDLPVPAGQYRVGLRAYSPYQADVSRTAELTLEVAPVAGLSINPYPEVVEGRGGGGFTVKAQNTGNSPGTVSLDVRDDQGVARILVQPATLSLPAQSAAEARVTVKLPVALTGAEKQFQIKITATDSRELARPVTATVRMVSRPLLTAAALKVLAGLVVVGAALLLLPLVVPQPTPAVTSSPTPTKSEPTPDTTTTGPAAPVEPVIVMTPENPRVDGILTFTATGVEPGAGHKWELSNMGGVDLPGGSQEAFSPTISEAGQYRTKLTVTTPGGSASSTMEFVVGVKLPPVYVQTVVATYGDGNGKAETLHCEDGHVPVSGGVRAVDGPTDEPFFRASRPADDGIGWLVSAGGASGRTVEFTAVCIIPPAGMAATPQRTREPAATAGRRALTAVCPAGQVVLGGGVSIGTANIKQKGWTLESTPGQAGTGQWVAWTAVVETADPTRASAFAFCSPPPPGYNADFRPTAVGASGTQDFPLACSGQTLSGGVGTEPGVLFGNLTTTGIATFIQTSAPRLGTDGLTAAGWDVRVGFNSEFGDIVYPVSICADLG